MKLRFILALITAISFVVGPPAGAKVSCASMNATSGEWHGYGGDLQNSRNQWSEDVVNAGNVLNVEPAWVFDAEAVQTGGGTFSNNPVVVDGCVYLGSSTGFVFALNAQNGEVVWVSDRLPGAPAGILVGGVITGSPVVSGGRVYVAVARAGDPFIGVLDQKTGKTIGLWPVLRDKDRGENNKYENTIIASPVVWNGVLFQGIMANEAGDVARGGWSVLDAKTGEILRQGWVISNAEYKAGYRGASIWCTPALDGSTGYLYACGGNPASKRLEHRFSNALLKFDLKRTRGGRSNPDFGNLVDSYKGDVDQYYPGLDRQPVCEVFGEDIAVVWSQACLQLDLDFGAAPNLFTDELGNVIVGALQKSGIYHAVYADHMERAWTTVVGGPIGPLGHNISASAFDGDSVYVLGSPPGQLVALNRSNGRVRWATPTFSGAVPFGHLQPVSVANGVVYGLDSLGNMRAFDTATGAPALVRPVSIDVEDSAADFSSQGVSIAYNTIFAASQRFVVAYR